MKLNKKIMIKNKSKLERTGINFENYLRGICCAMQGAYGKDTFLLHTNVDGKNQEIYLVSIINDFSIERYINADPECMHMIDMSDVISDFSQYEKIYFNYVSNEISENVVEAPFSVSYIYGNDKYNEKVQYCYDESLYDEYWVEIFHMHFISALNDALCDFDKPIKELIVVSDFEINIIDKVNQTAQPYSDNKCIHQIIEDVSERFPDRIALQDDDIVVTYKEFKQNVNALSNYLSAKGIGVGDYVAIAANRSIEAIYAIYAIMKSGAAYVPLSLKSPAERNNYIVGDCGAKLILTTENKRDFMPGVSVVNLTDKSVYECNEVEKSIVKPTDIAALIYTSGTTGVPKGVLIRHNTIVNYCEYNLREMPVKEDDIIAQFAPMSFSTSIYEISTTLFGGAKLCILKDEIIANIMEFHKCITDLKITLLLLPPEYANYVTPPDSIRLIETGASICQLETSEKIRERTRHLNAYGLTEGSIPTVWHGNPDQIHTRIPIGKPVSNCQVFVINNGKKCGMYMPGELCVTGLPVASGYLNLPKFSKERFIKNPYGNGTLLRTGDIVQWNYDGNLEYLGRNDNQVQIRGMRVELEEIERSLIKNDEISNAAVICREDCSGDNIIAAFVVSSLEINEADFKEKLKSNLPQYMIPTHIVQLESLPLTNNGKVDKNILKKINIQRSVPYSEPVTIIEKELANIFESIMQIKKVGRNDNFFELGGHSLRAMKLLNLIEIKHNVKLTVREIYQDATVAGMAKLIEITPKQEYDRIEKAEEKNYYKMTPAQRRLYVLQEIDDIGTAYNIPAGVKISGEIDVDIVKEVFQKLIERHKVLRTVFKMIDGKAVQEILADVKAEVEYEKSIRMVEEEKKIALKEFIRPFDLEQAPLMRLKVIEGEDESLLLFDIHHIISDGMSMNILIEEFSALYNGKDIDANELEYCDYSEWINNRDLSSQAECWKNEFADGGPVLNLVTDFPRPQLQSFKGGATEVKTEKQLLRNIKEYAKKNGTTEYMVLLGGAFILLEKYSGQEDIVIGSPISGRTHRDTECMLGMFVNTLAMRGRPNKEKRAADFIAEVKESCLRAYENQEYPFEDLLESVEVRRDLSKNALFDVMLVLQNNEQVELHLNGLKGEALIPEERAAKFDLTININEQEGAYRIEFEYCSDLYRKEMIDAMADHYMQILRELVKDNTKTIGEIRLLDKEEYTTVTESFNDTYMDYPRDSTLINLIEAQAKSYPEDIAVICGKEKLTYEKLNKKSNILGRRIRELGVMPNDFVAILSKRKIEMIEGIIGVLKSGGAYIPLDISLPDQRLKYMMEDSAPKAILTYGVTLPFETHIPIIDLGDSDVWSGDGSNLKHVNTPDDLAYCIYTSGTTGKPKGVMLTHKNVVNFCFNKSLPMKAIDNQEAPCIISTTSISFDIFVTESLFPLVRKIPIVLASDMQIESQYDIAELILDSRVNIIQTTPSKMKMYMMDEKYCEYLRNLNIIILGGEAFPSGLYEQLRKHTNAQIFNIYGPTETTVWVSTQRITGDCINIGKPSTNTQIFMLSGMELCGIGIPGELCIGGYQVGKGYLNRPELTAEKFIKNPFGEGRLYRTGDLARWLDDGNIEYLGRMDDQVKIRGYRIELQEIESVLRDSNTVTDAAVVVRRNKAGEPAICAYLIGEQEIDLTKVREYLSRKLPDYMIPAYMMKIDKLPLNNSGKVNRHALPEIDVKSEAEYIAPRNEIEEKIVQIFQDILQIERVGIKDSFFEIGGHSLRATRAVNRIEMETGVRLPLRSFFAYPTAEKIALLVNEEQEYDRIEKAEEKNYYKMTPAQRRLYVLQEIDDIGTAYNIPAGVKISGIIDIDKVKEVFQKLIERHKVLRTVFKMKDGVAVQEILADVKAEVEYEKSVRMVEEEKKIAFKEFIRPFDLEQAPLMRLKVIEGEDESLLLFDIHHIISDGMSMNILIKEFSALYNGKSIGEHDLEYCDYSEWINSRDISSQAEYWKNEFEDGGPVLNLVTDYPRPQLQSFKGEATEIKTEKEFLNDIKKYAKINGATEYMVLLGGAFILLEKYSGQEDIVIGSPISGRTHRDTECMLGMFVNTLAMRGRPNKEKRATDFIAEVKESCLRAYENQEYPFEDLVESVDVRRDLSKNALFDVMLVLQNNEQVEMHLNGLKGEALIPEERAAKFDLTININEQEGAYRIEFEYCSDLYRKEMIDAMADQYMQILRELVKDDTRTIGEISLLNEEEYATVTESFNDTYMEYPRDRTVISLIENQAKVNTDKAALLFESESQSYGELNRRANQLGRKLRELGVKPNNLIAIVAKRGLEMIDGIVGVWKSGGAYVPIAPDYPEDRLKYMLVDSSPKVILTYGISLPFDTDIPIINLKNSETWTGDDSNLEHVNSPNDLAYCIYTSGTTGKPKGTLIEHRGLLFLNFYQEKCVNIGSADNVLQFANFTFDASVAEITMALLAGGCLHLVSEETMHDPEKITSFIADKHITAALFTPNFAAYLELKDLETVITGGSAANRQVIEKTCGRYINAYGPTECTVCATAWEYEKGMEIPEQIPIGKPIANAQIYMLSGMELCGIGIPGELCIGGDGVGRGYLNRSELTGEKFIENPFGKGRLYRTGDLARWLEDGNIEYLGRIDDQIKIRGYRVELQEIETILRNNETVTDAAVVARKDKTDEITICAYVIGEQEIDLNKIREYLSRNLPDYMIPAYMMQIEKLPLNNSGKVDRHVLPEIEIKSEAEFAAPKNETEEMIVQIFQDVLGIEEIGVKDNFFEMGGDSIKALRVVSKIRELGYEIKVRDIMQSKTVEQIVSSAQWIMKDTVYEQGEVKGALSLTPIQEYFYSQNYEVPGHFNQAIMLCGKEGFDEKAVRQALEAIVVHHDILRAVYTDGRQEILSTEDSNKYEMKVYKGIGNEQMEAECERLQSSFDLSAGPLMKVALFKEENDFLLICIHHLVIDGVSWRILLEDFKDVYTQVMEGKKIKLPPKTAPYMKWSEALKEYAKNQELLDQLAYWQNICAKGKGLGLKPQSSAWRYKETRMCLSQDTTKNLLYEAGKAYNTEINDLLLAALGKAVKQWFGCNQVLIDTEGHGREHINDEIIIDRTVGWFTSLYPILLSSDDNDEDQIINTKEMLRKIPSHGIGYGVLKYLSRCSGLDTESEICFNYLGEAETGDYGIQVSQRYTGRTISEQNNIRYALVMNGSIQSGALTIGISYDISRLSDKDAHNFSNTYEKCLEEIIQSCLSVDSEVKTASDFNLEALSQDEYTEIYKMFN